MDEEASRFGACELRAVKEECDDDVEDVWGGCFRDFVDSAAPLASPFCSPLTTDTAMTIENRKMRHNITLRLRESSLWSISSVLPGASWSRWAGFTGSFIRVVRVPASGSDLAGLGCVALACLVL